MLLTMPGCPGQAFGSSTDEGELQPGGRGFEFLEQAGEGDANHLLFLRRQTQTQL